MKEMGNEVEEKREDDEKESNKVTKLIKLLFYDVFIPVVFRKVAIDKEFMGTVFKPMFFCCCFNSS
jgi:hypothetical protein